MRARYMPLIDMLTEIHDMLMTRLHEKRDTMQQIDCVVVPSIRRKLEEAVEESTGYRVLWDGRENYVVKGHRKNVCPDKPPEGQPPQPKKTGAKKKKNQEPEVAEESHTEVHMQKKENETGESHLMDEAMADMDDIIQDLPTNSRAQNAMKFMPTPSLHQLIGT
ncbi:hypothetical protein POM88_021251 [Heracleum sosnowskyi]|uniref:Uncharacterized protein n=1 Tax=Heracleum sosnowskyi TaxID=360622 RepID=A0AAD8IEH0_9APIA|nr:hypothetical protein POM88_021251 [Heracleum sosnowskyi]